MGMKPYMLLIALTLMAAEPVQFLGKPYRLAAFSHKVNPLWEFTAPNETVENWSTLLTIVDRPDAKTRPDLDRLAQGIMDTYKSNGGRVLMAKTFAGADGVPYNYMVVAFEQPAQKRYELNFVKAAMGAKNAYMAIYGVRVQDAKTFLNEHSAEIGKALERAQLPPVAALPRK